MKISILTVSDRSFRNVRPDLSGPALREFCLSEGWEVIQYQVVPDDKDKIEKVLTDWSDSNKSDIILTTGGTGFSPRDVTPEATENVIHRRAPGLPEAMRQSSLKITPHAMLSRATAGIRGHTLIINLPGSPKAAIENLTTIKSVLNHAIDLLVESPGSEQGHQYSKRP